MPTETEKVLEQMYFISSSKIKLLDKFFAKTTMRLKEKISKEQKSFFHKVQNELGNISIVSNVALYLALNKVYNLYYGKDKRKNKSLKLHNVRSNNELIMKSMYKSRQTPKKDFLLDHVADLRDCIEMELSLREMTDFFKKKYRVKLSHTYLKKFIDEFKIKEQIKKDK